jgi:hypothetical protein
MGPGHPNDLIILINLIMLRKDINIIGSLDTYVEIRANLCMYVRIYVCMYVCMHVCMYVCTYACMHVWMYACMHTRMYTWT